MRMNMDIKMDMEAKEKVIVNVNGDDTQGAREAEDVGEEQYDKQNDDDDDDV